MHTFELLLQLVLILRPCGYEVPASCGGEGGGAAAPLTRLKAAAWRMRLALWRPHDGLCSKAAQLGCHAVLSLEKVRHRGLTRNSKAGREGGGGENYRSPWIAAARICHLHRPP